MLDFEYGVNTNNRFLQFVDHEEEPDAFIAAQTQADVPAKKSSTKDSKTTTTTKKVTSQSSTSASSATKTNKENLTSKSSNVDQRRQPSASTSNVFTDNNQQTRSDSARGARGMRRGGQFDNATRGRSQRFNKFEGQQGTSSFDQAGEGWSNEVGRGAGARRGNSDAPRGSATGRGGGRGARGGRGNYGNRTFEEGQQVDTGSWQADSYDASRAAGNDLDVSPQERPFEADGTRRNTRGNYRGRGHSNRNYADRGEGAEGNQEDYRANRRLHDRQPRNFVSTVKPIEKKDGEGAHNWGNPTENPEDHPIADETEGTGQTGAAVAKDWAQQVDEAEKQMTFDEYKRQLEAKKRANQEKLRQFNTRTAGEGEDPKVWQKPIEVYRKKSNVDGSDDEGEEGSAGEEHEEEEEEDEEEQISGKKKLISIPLHFKPIEMPRNSSRGGRGRGSGNPRYREQSNRDEPSASNTGNQESTSQGAEESQTSFRAGSSRGGRGDYRRSFGNSARGSRQGRSQNDPNAPALDNPEDFPTLPKQ